MTTMLRPSNAFLDSIIGKQFPIHEFGFIRVIDYMGDDSAVAQAARVSYGAGTKSVREDKGLIRYLLKHGHWSPFEMAHIKFHVKLPIFVARQWIRHKFHVNEYSQRYSNAPDESYLPGLDEIGSQSSGNKQSTDIQSLTEAEKILVQQHITEVIEYANKAYHGLLKGNCSREIARIVLPVAGYTEWYMETNLRDLMHFVRQRSDSHAQPAIRQYSDFIRDEILQHWCPASYDAFVDYIQDAITLSGNQQKYLSLLINAFNHRADVPKPEWISKRDAEEVIQFYEKMRK